MKKVIWSLFLLLSVNILCSSLYAQKKNVSKAKNLSLMETPDFKGARESIQSALKDSTTKNAPMTWYVAGLIGYKENEAFFKEQVLGKKIDFVKKGEAIVESIDYLKKAYELDQNQFDKKGKKIKPKYDSEIKTMFKEYYEDQNNLFSYAAVLFDEKKDYKGALNVFETYLDIPKLPYMKDVVKMDTTYTKVKYYTALAARNAENWQKAIEIHEDMKDDGFQTSFVYQLLYEEYVQLKDTANFIKTLEEGFQKMPEEPWFIQNLINYYISNNMIKESKMYIAKAIEISPDVAVYHYVKAKIDEVEKNFVDARAAYNKTIELDPKYADAYNGIGVLILEEGQKILDDAAYKSDKEFNLAKKKADEVFKTAIDYFLKASELNPEELTYKRNLRMLYYRLGMSKELEAIEKELGY
ncbi:MAG: hypothetical protein VB102_06155 [Paludibacter sp.]|nr:hypothetical protein [Paludibacter sp.]